MAKLHGRGGSVVGMGIAAGIHTWGMDVVGDIADVSDFTDVAGANWFRTFLAGLQSWSGTINCFVDDAGPPPGGWDFPGDTVAAAIFNFDGAHNLSGEIIISGWTVGVPVGDVETIDIAYQGTGALGRA